MTAARLFTNSVAFTRSPFTGVDVCREAGLTLPDQVKRPMFEDDLWDLADVVGLPVSLALQHRRFDFTPITNLRWRLVAKELVIALLAPHHDAVSALARAYRAVHHVSTCHGRLAELTRFFKWLTATGVHSLEQLHSDDCDAYLAHRRHHRDPDGVVVGERGSGTRRLAALIVTDLLNYRELFTADRVPADLRPWGGATASAIAEDTRAGQNKTPPVSDEVLQPMLAAALHLVNVIGPHVADLARQLRTADRQWSARADGLKTTTRVPLAEITQLLAEYERASRPLPLLQDHHVQARIDGGWSPHDPLAPIALSVLVRQAGFRQFYTAWLPQLRAPVEATLKAVGAAKLFGWNAIAVERADGQGSVAWTLPLHKEQATALTETVRTASILVLAAITGMRASELMELRAGCCRPPQQHGPGLIRYRLASKLIKDQPLGGTHDEWVVIEAAYQAATLAEQLHDPAEAAPLFGRFHFNSRYQWFRQWVNSPAGQRHGLAAIPDGPLNMRMLRRRLAIELAYRPGGLLATKIHLRHVSAATSEGYASRPGGSQARLLAEVSDHEQQRNLDLLWAELRNYQAGIMPAGPGAKELTEFFAHVDGKLSTPEAVAPKVQRNDREVLNLMNKRAQTLHLGVANYCWFTDPAQALCLKLAETPHATKPLAGMCDSARCPQATHHIGHRTLWAEHAHNTKTFLGDLGPTRKTERARLQADYDRAARVLADIDAAVSKTEE